MADADGELARIAERYAKFAVNEVQGECEIYKRLALAVAGSEELLAFLAGVPPDRRQPNLFLAAVRYLCGVPDSAERLVQIVRGHHGRIREVMLSRTTQTNEPARCSVLLPLLAQVPQPLALLEIGASAGLCLLPDRYGYDYGTKLVEPSVPVGSSVAPVFACKVRGAVPLPAAVPRIAWRRGLDLNPIDSRSEDGAAWLETLVWPGRPEPAQRLRAAIAVARRELPKVVRGDLQADLVPLAAAAPQDATLVVFHTAVLAYVASRPPATGSPKPYGIPRPFGSATRHRRCSRPSPRGRPPHRPLAAFCWH
jgi:Uncharacterized protein conserved in bacteria (DUF2332)